MKYCIVVDSSASLPEAFVEERGIKILPLTIQLNGENIPDYTSEKDLIALYASGQINSKADINTTPFTSEQMKQHFLEKIVPNYDMAICQTVSKDISQIYDHLNSVVHTIARDSRELRNELEISHPFRITHINTGTSGSGQGLIAVFAEAFMAKDMDFNKYKLQVQKFKTVVKGFTVVKDIIYSRHRSRMRGLDVVSLPKAFIGKIVGVAPIVLVQNDVLEPVVMPVGFAKSIHRLFTYAIVNIKHGLYFNCVNVGIAGSTKELEAYPAFVELRKTAKEYNVTFLVSVLTLATSINFSPGCITLGIAPKEQSSQP